MISLHAYQSVEDAWQEGVAAWCRAASPFVLSGGRAWMVTASDGQVNWIKRRLLQEGASLVGLQFLNAQALRRELCVFLALPLPTLDQNALEFTLRLHALTRLHAGSEWSAIARHPGACLAALDDLATAHWLNDPGLLDDVLLTGMEDWLAELQSSHSWHPAVDQRLAERATTKPAGSAPLTLCVLGCDASYWASFNLLTAAARNADSAYLFTPLPRGSSEGLQQAWLDALETRLESQFSVCDGSSFPSAQSILVGRLEGVDYEASPERPAPPEMLVGADLNDTVALVCDYAARWLLQNAVHGDSAMPDGADRLALLSPCRNPSSVALVRALSRAGIAVEDELGELPEPSLAVQIQLAILDYHQNKAGLDPLLTLIELLNESVASWRGEGAEVLQATVPLDAAEVRRALHGAFAEIQHHNSHLLAQTASLGRTPVAKSLRRLVDHLGEWPEKLSWQEARERWASCLDGLGLTTKTLEPFWSNVADMPVRGLLPASAFFQYLTAALHDRSARRVAGAPNRFARVVVTTLESATGQTWGGVLFLDSHEGAWPLYPPENPFLNDTMRAYLNGRRVRDATQDHAPHRGHLLTSSDRAQLEHFRFLELLENCAGPLAFAAVAHDPSDPNREQYPNEWALRCLVESRWAPAEGEKLLDRWRRSVRRVRPFTGQLPKSEKSHLADTFARRRDPATAFDDYFFNFEALTGPDQLPWSEAWSAGDLDSAWNRPATFALAQIFDAEPWRDGDRRLTRGEGWMVGRLVHRWMGLALGMAKEPRKVGAHDWQEVWSVGLDRARHETEKTLIEGLLPTGKGSSDGLSSPKLPLWWWGILRKAEWATRRCLETLQQTVEATANADTWLCLGPTFRADLRTAVGPLRLQARSDIVLLDQPQMAGANCRLIDIRTGAAPGSGTLPLTQIEQGHDLNLAATLFLAVAAGARVEHTHSGVIHPDFSNVDMLDASAAPDLSPALGRLAQQQRTLVFGQRGAIVQGYSRTGSENLPLATTPVDPATLAQKATVTLR